VALAILLSHDLLAIASLGLFALGTAANAIHAALLLRRRDDGP
jgi:hypothetical protein